MAKTNYGAADITQMEFLEAIRKLPGMYIGDTEEHGLHHLPQEVVDNAIDECMNGNATVISVAIEKDGSFTVADDGRGIPVEYKPDLGCSSLTVVFTKPHAGGKFNKSGEDSAYSASGGLHGIGLKCVTAMSSHVSARIKRHGLTFVQTFEKGGAVMSPVEIYDCTDQWVGEINAATELVLDKAGIALALLVNGKKTLVAADPHQGTGSEITFRPHRPWFSQNMEWDNPEKNVPWNVARLETRFAQISFLHPGVQIELLDKRQPKSDQQKKVFCSQKGLEDYVAYLNEGLHPLHKPILFDGEQKIDVNGTQHSVKTRIALQYCVGEDMETNIVAFTNSIPNPLGGVHVTAFKAGFSRAINSVALSKKWIKSADDFRNEDVFAGMTAIVTVSMTNTPQFLSQTKEALNSPEVKGPVLSATYDFMTEFFNKSNNAEIGKLIVRQAMTAKESREAAQKVRQTMIRKSGLDAGLNFIGKTADITRSGGEPIVPKEYTALYIVEGDSAGGSAKQGRDRRFHAILPLRGKPENVEKVRNISKVLENEEIKTLVTAIGAGIGADFEVENMRYGRIVMMSDADVDGSHIRALLITFFWRFMRPLIEAGKLYAARPPLFLITQKRGNGREYAYSDAERDEIVKKLGGFNNVEITRYKGLGEMDASQLTETVLVVPPGYAKGEGGKRAKKNTGNGDGKEAAAYVHTVADFAYRDIQLTVEDVHKANEMIGLWMGDRPKDRNEWLMNHSWDISAD
ncbi:MAG TPA: toprim domain-containing protein [Anaerolineaceae bacterium]|jgi:DNA gyrase subunit B